MGVDLMGVSVNIAFVPLLAAKHSAMPQKGPLKLGRGEVDCAGRVGLTLRWQRPSPGLDSTCPSKSSRATAEERGKAQGRWPV